MRPLHVRTVAWAFLAAILSLAYVALAQDRGAPEHGVFTLSPAWINTVILAVIGGLVAFAMKMLLGKIQDFHRDAMVHLDDIKEAVSTIEKKVDGHITDHARGVFRGGP